MKLAVICLSVCFLFMAASLAAHAASYNIVITLERTPCLGNCPNYKVTIHGDGSVVYQGRIDVAVKGRRKSKISPEMMRKLVQELHDIDFFHWHEKEVMCVDYPETRISATVDGQHNEIIEGCNQPGRILDLANEIDTISGAKLFIGKSAR
jgi:hypothetical protein